MKAIVDVLVEGNTLRVVLFGVCIFEHECEYDLELRQHYVRDIKSKGNIIDKEV